MTWDLSTAFLPFQFAFMQNAFLISALIAVPVAVLSCFLVLKGWALMGDAVSHAILPGVVLAYVLNIPLLIGAFVAGMLCAVATGYLAENSRVKQDTVMGIVFSGMFGLGLVLYVALEPSVHLEKILFGNMLGVGPEDLWTTGIIAVTIGAGLLLKWRDLMLHSFDPVQAQTAGLPVWWLHYGLLACLSLTIVATLSATGLILAIGLLIAPGAIAFLLVRTFRAMLWVSTLVCFVALVTGTYASFYLDSAPAPTIILILTALFVVAFVRRQLLTRVASRRPVDPGPQAEPDLPRS